MNSNCPCYQEDNYDFAIIQEWYIENHAFSLDKVMNGEEEEEEEEDIDPRCTRCNEYSKQVSLGLSNQCAKCQDVKKKICKCIPISF
jgi:hypothetical protein